MQPVENVWGLQTRLKEMDGKGRGIGKGSAQISSLILRVRHMKEPWAGRVPAGRRRWTVESEAPAQTRFLSDPRAHYAVRSPGLPSAVFLISAQRKPMLKMFSAYHMEISSWLALSKTECGLLFQLVSPMLGLCLCVCGGGLTSGEGHRCGLLLRVVLSLVTFVSSLSRVLLAPLPTWKLNMFKLFWNNRKSDASTSVPSISIKISHLNICSSMTIWGKLCTRAWKTTLEGTRGVWTVMQGAVVNLIIPTPNMKLTPIPTSAVPSLFNILIFSPRAKKTIQLFHFIAIKASSESR